MMDGYEPDNWKHLPSIGSYGGFVGMWRYQGEARNEFFRAAARWCSDKLTADGYEAIFGWQLLDGTPPAGISGYSKLTHGNSQGDTPAVPLISRKFSAITSLRYTTRSQIASVQQLSALMEFWTTGVPCPSGPLVDVKAEVGCYTNMCEATRDWASSLLQVGKYTDPETSEVLRVATTENAVPFLTFRPDNGQSLMHGSHDWKDRVTWLRAQGFATDDWNYNGIGHGPEPIKGDGAALVSLRCAAYS